MDSFWNKPFDYEKQLYLLTAILLVPLNWGIETLKWRSLTGPFQRQSFSEAARAVLGGVSLGLFTPGRIGEYGGRILLMKTTHVSKAVLAMILSNLIQLATVIWAGLIGAVFFLKSINGVPDVTIRILSFGVIFWSITVLTAWWNFEGFWLFLTRFNWIKKKLKAFHYGELFDHYDRKFLVFLFLLTIFRYGVFSLQYLLLLWGGGIELPPWVGLAGISLIFLIQTSIPLPGIGDFLTRGEAALIIWGSYSDDTIAILMAAFGLWIINLMLPSLLGLHFIANVNILKSLGYENEHS